jgi:ABC-type lipoprotein release transport system permease subunit
LISRIGTEILTPEFSLMLSVLSPLVYCRRNPGRVLPPAFVIVLAVTLVAGVVSIVRSINLTVYTLYGNNRYFTGLTPRNALHIDPAQIDKIKKLPELGTLCPTHSYQTMVKTIFGKMPFPLFGLDKPCRELLLQRCGLKLVAGRMPAEGAPEVVISDLVAKNLGLKIGDIISKPNSQDSYAPIPLRLVGLLHGPVWLGLTSKSLADTYSPFTFTGYMAFAPTASQAAQRRLDAAVERVLDKGKARIWKFAGLVEETQSALSNLYLILNIVVGIIVFAISFVCGLLSNIYFTQRLPEMATLSAIGYTRGYLLRRATGETALLCLFGWLLGGLLTVGMLWLIRIVAMEPRGLLLNAFDPRAFLFTLPLPITITLFAVVTIGLRLAALDPVSIIEHRG